MHKLKNPDAAILILRIFVAAIFVIHGVSKLMNIEGTQMFFQIIGLPTVLAPIVGGAEVLFGALMLFGFGTTFAALGIIATMIVAIVKVKVPMGGALSAEFEALLLVSALTIIMSGSGRYSLGRKCGCVGSCGCDSKKCDHGVCVDNKCGCDCHSNKVEQNTQSQPVQNTDHQVTI